MKYFEIRDPVHGFVRFNELERDVINHSAFQRLRRIRQLAWTDMVYPGAMHTRLTTILYVAESEDLGNRFQEDALLERVAELKPMFNLQLIKHDIDDLRERGFLSS